MAAAGPLRPRRAGERTARFNEGRQMAAAGRSAPPLGAQRRRCFNEGRQMAAAGLEGLCGQNATVRRASMRGDRWLPPDECFSQTSVTNRMASMRGDRWLPPDGSGKSLGAVRIALQ